MVKLLTEKQVQDFKTDGFCSPITVMTESEALKLRQSLEAFEQQYPEMLASDQRNNTHLTLPVIDQIAHNSTILDAIEDEDEKIGAGILIKALSAPCMQVAENAGIEGAVVLSKVLQSLSLEKGVSSSSSVMSNQHLFLWHGILYV